ncbi:hypothetical protein GCM10011609_86250 [Lentzea pudingi]|uniref:DUF4365 domain-containing protein n=1 Tax=Lentzea pudingi TaxID=1789439 RepID=A0ABQ2IW06_9PSEU|nr:DUF4365 domain-containing protein [Lentzea pudingi]GGN29321.1 hypothetical protein GCM10011609_86250 [Lentzea pudingi]
MTGLDDVGLEDAADDLVVGGLPKTASQEQFSLAFVQMVAAAAGCSIKSHSTDYDGVDITIVSSETYKNFFGPQFELQVKCTTQQRYLTEQHLAWPMKAKPFTKLTRTDLHPRLSRRLARPRRHADVARPGPRPANHPQPPVLRTCRQPR